MATPPPLAQFQKIASPCIKVCAVDGETGLCLGCGRTLPEIAAWVKLSSADRDQTLNDLPARLDRLRSMGKL